MPRRRLARGQLVLSWLFLLLFCVLAPLALISGWARQTVSNEDDFLRAVQAVADDPRVQRGLAETVTQRTQAMLGGENPTATEAVQNRVLAEELGEATSQVVASQEFRTVWEAANRGAYRLLASGLQEGWGQPVALDLSPLQGQLQADLDALDVDLPEGLTIEPETLQLELLDSETADRIRRALQQLNVVFWASLVGAAVALLLSIILALDRLAAVGHAAFGLAIAMVATLALMLAAQGALAARVSEAGGNAVVTAISDAISQPLRLVGIALTLGGLLVAGIFAGLCALRGDRVVG